MQNAHFMHEKLSKLISRFSLSKTYFGGAKYKNV